MTRLPAVTARDVQRVLVKAGFEAARQSGSHRIYKHGTDPRRRVIVPQHTGANLKIGTLRAIMRQAGLSTAQFTSLL